MTHDEMVAAFPEGTEVTWRYTIPTGYNETAHVPAKVVGVTDRRVRIQLTKFPHIVRSVTPDRLIVRAPTNGT